VRNDAHKRWSASVTACCLPACLPASAAAASHLQWSVCRTARFTGEQGVKWTLDAVFTNHSASAVSGVGVVKFARDETRARPELPWQQVSDHYAIDFTLHF
jgi:hypothetical protein